MSELSLDEFAARAMQGLVASDAFHGPLYQQHPAQAAAFAYDVAEAMVAEREHRFKRKMDRFKPEAWRALPAAASPSPTNTTKE